MRNLKFIIAFNGARYHGFQRQPNAATIQGELENALEKITGANKGEAKSAAGGPQITGCSRTDAGVHARQFGFNTRIAGAIPAENLVKAMNAMLPPDIAVLSCEQADNSFNARFDTRGKEYIYLINNKKQRDVFMQSLAYHYPYKFNPALMREAAQTFIGEHDFAAFCKSEGLKETHSTVREIYSFNIEEQDGMFSFIIRGNAFLYNMVRIMAGTLIYVNEGKRSVSDITEALLSRNREKAGKTLPPCGLYLNKVFY